MLPLPLYTYHVVHHHLCLLSQKVSSTEVGSASWSRSPRDFPQTQSHIQPPSSPQVSTNANILPSVNPYSLAAFMPPPGIVDDTHRAPVNGDYFESEPHTDESPSPRRAFDNPSVLDDGIIPMYPGIQSTRTFQPVQASFRVLREKSLKDSQNLSRALRGNISQPMQSPA